MASLINSFLFIILTLLLLLLLLPSLSLSQPYKNVTLNSSLTAQNNNNNSFWASLSGDFSFGFLQFGNNGFLLAIWFNKILQKTVVWSANRNDLVPEGSRVELTNNGELVLNNGATRIWTANSAQNVGSVSHAAMLDNGNFILASTSQVLWQSFDEPTDTILPSQSIKNRDLTASYSQTNYSEGRFRFSMEGDGNLVSTDSETIPARGIRSVYWESGTQGSGFELVFNLSASIYISAPNGSVVTTLTDNSPSTLDFYHRAVFEYDGVFRQYVYPKSGNNSAWPKAWSQVSNSVPPNSCLTIITGLGGGVCGFNSYCSLGDDDDDDDNRRSVCRCPRGYERVDPNDAAKGCKPSFVAQSCNDDDDDAFEFFSIENSDWPHSDYEAFSDVNEDWCRRICMNDCFCAAIIFDGNQCWKKKFPLSFGRIDLDYKGKALIKFRKDINSTYATVNPLKKVIKNKVLVVVGSILMGVSSFLISILLVAYQLVTKRRKLVIKEENLSLLGLNVRVFSYEELKKATSGFTQQLGFGAFATVYKGTLDYSIENNLVAVKKLDNSMKEGDQEFKAEVSAIARTNHKNLVQLLGFCNEEPHRMLVYEYMQNGSVADFIFGAKKPNWYKRIQVILGTARGLCYLHEECDTQIIHCDIKPQNILLDESLVARISDFGLAKLLNKNQTRTMTAIRGTKGYVAPEWFRSLPITTKVDVYSFGIVLLEIVCCRKSFEGEMEDRMMVLGDWAYDCFRERKVEELVKDDDEAMEDIGRVEKFVMVAIWCIQEEPSLRPSMNKVIQMLEGAVGVSTPPDPSSSISTL